MKIHYMTKEKYIIDEASINYNVGLQYHNYTSNLKLNEFIRQWYELIRKEEKRFKIRRNKFKKTEYFNIDRIDQYGNIIYDFEFNIGTIKEYIKSSNKKTLKITTKLFGTNYSDYITYTAKNIIQVKQDPIIIVEDLFTARSMFFKKGLMIPVSTVIDGNYRISNAKYLNKDEIEVFSLTLDELIKNNLIQHKLDILILAYTADINELELILMNGLKINDKYIERYINNSYKTKYFSHKA